MFVYTFWEPRENMPFYLQLCIETWKKFLPNATIVVLDYKNIGEFIDVRELDLKLFSGRFQLMQIADAIRVALLAKHGGVWLDADTIILSSNAEKYFLPDDDHKIIFFGNPKTKVCRICFMNAPPQTMCMNLWHEFIREQIWNVNSATSVRWDFLGNKFIDEYSKKHSDEIKIFDTNLVMPEKKLISDSISYQASYSIYYFLQNHHLADISAEMLLLHNNWTPDFFKQLTTDNFLSVDCTMVNILAEALDIKLPPPNTVPESNSRTILKKFLIRKKSRRAFDGINFFPRRFISCRCKL